jgi:hypothetical protein
VADAQQESEPLEVWPEHWDAVRLFQACDSQWTVLLGMGGLYYQGLDMSKVEIVRGWLQIEPSADLLGQLRVMTNEAKKYLNG